MKSRIGKIIIFSVLMVGLASCSYRQIFFEFHNFFATRAAVNFFDLNERQKIIFKERWEIFTRIFAASNLTALSKNIQNLSQVNEPSDVIEALQNIGKIAFVDACTIFSPLMADLSDAQLEYFKSKIEDRNQKFDPAKNGGVEKYRQAKKNELISTIEKWVGILSKSQKDLVLKLDEEKYREQPTWERDYLLFSRDSQNAFVAVIAKNRGDAEKLGQKCGEYVRSPELFLSDDSKAFRAKLNQSRGRFLRELFVSLNEKQRQFLSHETRKLALELTAWSQSLTE